MYGEFDFKDFYGTDAEHGIAEFNTAADITELYLARLFACIGVADAAEDAKRLVLRYGSLDAVMSAEPNELMVFVDKRTALFIKLVAYANSRRTVDAFLTGLPYSGEELCRLATALFVGKECETVYLLSLDRVGRLLSVDNLGDGTVNTSEIYPRKIVETAVRRGSKDVIIAHNHPGGVSKPSRADILATARLYSSCVSAGVRLRKHIIVADRDYSVLDIDQATAEVTEIKASDATDEA